MSKSSSALSAGYITGTSQVDARTQLHRSYKNRQDVAHMGHEVPDTAPAWARDVGTYWNAIDAHVDALIDKKYRSETVKEHMKKTARTHQKIVIALPVELGIEDHLDFVKSFYNDILKPRGCVVTWAIHLDDENPHVHFQVGLHHIEDDIFLPKIDRFMYGSSYRIQQRHYIGAFYNPILESRGFNERINTQSYDEMGVDIEAQIHEGPYARREAEEGRLSRVCVVNDHIRDDNREKLLSNTKDILTLLAASYATFSEKNVYEFVYKHMKHDALLTAHVYACVMRDVIKISGHDMETNMYTTKQYKGYEERAIDISTKMLDEKTSFFVGEDTVETYLREQEEAGVLKGLPCMSDEQKKAVRLLCSEHRLTFLVGRAGTGKTTSLKAIVDLFKAQKIPIMGAAIAAQAAQNLENEAGVSSHTIDRYLLSMKLLKENEKTLQRGDVRAKDRLKILKAIETLKKSCIPCNSALIVDEAGMIGTQKFSELFEVAQEYNVKLMFVGDDRQFKSVDSGDLFRYLIEKSAFAGRQAVLSHNYRQMHVPWMSRASMQLSNMNVIDPLQAYDDHGMLLNFDHEDVLLKQIVSDYLAIPAHESCCVLSYTREKVGILNAQIRKGLQDLGRLSLDETLLFGQKYAVGDRFIFLKNMKQTSAKEELMYGKYVRIEGALATGMRIRNGMQGTIMRIEAIKDQVYRVSVLVKEGGHDHLVTFNTQTVKKFSHGYATTLYKSQGQTVDRVLLYMTQHMDMMATYVAFTRHRYHMRAYYLNGDFENFHTLCDRLGKIRAKDLLVDYARDMVDVDAFDRVCEYKAFGLQISQMINSHLQEERDLVPHLMEEKAYRAREMLKEFSRFGPMLLTKGISQKQLEITAGLQMRILSKAEREIITSIHAYVEASKACREVYEEIIKTHPSVYAKWHDAYSYLETLQERRGALALRLHQDEVLLKAYAHDIFKACGYGLATVQKQADAYIKLVVKKDVFSKLCVEDRDLVLLYEEGMEKLKEARRLFKQNEEYDKAYQDMKKQARVQKLLFKTMTTAKRREQQECMQNAGSGVMYYFKQNPHLFNRVLSLCQGYDTLDELDVHHCIRAADRFQDQMMIACAAGQYEMKAIQDAHDVLHQYDVTNDVNICGNAYHMTLTQMESAALLLDRIQDEEQQGAKAKTKATILNQVGYEGLLTIYHNARDAKRLQFARNYGQENMYEKALMCIEYGQAKLEANRLWELVTKEALQKRLDFEKTHFYEAHQRAAAQKDMAAFYAIDTYGIEALQRLNVLWRDNGLGISMDRMEREAKRGRIHHACQLIHSTHVSLIEREDAKETLLLALMCERESHVLHQEDHMPRVVLGIMASYKVYAFDLEADVKAVHEKKAYDAIKMGSFKEMIPEIEAYQQALRHFSVSYATAIKKYPKMAFDGEPEVIAVFDGIKKRNEAAYHLQQSMQRHQRYSDQDRGDVFDLLKITPQHFLQHCDEYESDCCVQDFIYERDENKKRDIAFKLVEKMRLEDACQQWSTVRSAIQKGGLDLRDVMSCVRWVSKYPLLSADQQEAIHSFEKDVEESRHFHEIARQQLKALEKKKAMNKHLALPSISHVGIYDTYWKSNMSASQKAYALLKDKEVCAHLSSYDCITMGRYAHQYQTTLLLKAYDNASRYGNPIACLIALEMCEMLEFENLMENKAAKHPLMKGTWGLVFALNLRWDKIFKDAKKVMDGPALSYNDVAYLQHMCGSYLPDHAIALLQKTQFKPFYEQEIKNLGYGVILKHRGSDLDLSKDYKNLQEVNMKDVKETAILHGNHPLGIEPTSKSDAAPVKPIVIVDMHHAFNNKGHFKKDHRHATSDATSDESTFYALSAADNQKINDAYYKAFKERIDYPTSDQQIVMDAVLGVGGKKQRDGSYHWPNGFEYHPHGIGGKSSRSVFKAWGNTHKNLSLYDIAKMKGFCENYADFIRYASERIGFSKEDFYKEKIRELKYGRVSSSSTSISKTNDTKAYGPDIRHTSCDNEVMDLKGETNDRYTPLAIVPKNRKTIYPQTLEHAGHLYGTPRMMYAYRHLNGDLMGYTVRFDNEDKKNVIPFAFCSQENGPSVWQAKRFNGGIPGYVPLYGLEKLRLQPNAPVLLVEGEKAANAAQEQFPDLVVMSWMGGVGSVGKINLKPLEGRDVLMWPDNDEAGFKAADQLKEHLQKINVNLHILDIPQEKLPKKWDLADPLPEGITPQEVRGVVMHSLTPMSHVIHNGIINGSTSVEKLFNESDHIKTETSLSEIYHMTNGIYDKLVSFSDIQATCARYDLRELIQRKSADELMMLVSYAMNDLKNLSSWSSMVSVQRNADTLKDQAILSTLMVAYVHDNEPIQASFQGMMRAKAIGFDMARQCIENPKDFDVYHALKKARQVEDMFEKVQTHFYKGMPCQQISSAGLTDVDALRSVERYDHLCKAAFGETLPENVKEYLQQKVLNSTKIIPKGTTAHTYHMCIHVLMTDEAYKIVNPHVRREIHTHEDLVQLYKAQDHFRESYKTTQQLVVQDHVLERQRSRGMEMSM